MVSPLKSTRIRFLIWLDYFPSFFLLLFLVYRSESRELTLFLKEKMFRKLVVSPDPAVRNHPLFLGPTHRDPNSLFSSHLGRARYRGKSGVHMVAGCYSRYTWFFFLRAKS